VSQAIAAGNREHVLTADATTGLLSGVLCVLLFGLLNPFLALLAVAVMETHRRTPAFVFIVSATTAFLLFFWLRDYGVEWFPDISTDDVPNYIWMYQQNYSLTFSGVLERFFEEPNGSELLWNLPWWVLINYFNGSDDTFVLLHYIAIFFGLFVALYTITRRYVAAFALVYMLLTPITIDGLVHIWRQQLALTMFMIGIGLYLARGHKSGRWLIYLTPLMHFSVIFFVLAFMTFEFVRNFRGYSQKLKFGVLLTLIVTVIPVMASIAVGFLDSLGLARIMLYFEGYGADPVRVYLITALYVLPMLAAFFFLKNDDMNYLFAVLSFAVFSIVLALPSANSIYDRLLMFSQPFMGLFFYRCLLRSGSPSAQVPALLLIFVYGVARLYQPTKFDEGVMTFLAYGHAFDPFMGIAKMLVSL
jgi:hypothetical protein